MRPTLPLVRNCDCARHPGTSAAAGYRPGRRWSCLAGPLGPGCCFAVRVTVERGVGSVEQGAVNVPCKKEAPAHHDSAHRQRAAVHWLQVTIAGCDHRLGNDLLRVRVLRGCVSRRERPPAASQRCPDAALSPALFWKVVFKIRAQPVTAHDASLCHKY